tara:strand:+ start:79 stop:456 length:378 start_codon:yes stop_codon:yes gene_type:complete
MIGNIKTLTSIDFSDAMDNLLDGIGNSYANWNKGSDSPNSDRVRNRVNEFRDGLKINPGRKFDKIIEKNRVWGFVAKTDGILKGIPYFKGDVFKAASWRAPAKHVRGSIFDTNTDWYSWTGPNYL